MDFPKTYPPGEGPQQVRALVDDLLPRFVAGEDTISAVLREQLRRARIGTIELSGAGFFADIDVPADAPVVEPRDFAGGSAFLELTGVPGGGGCVLFVRDGRLSFLDCYTYGPEEWTEDTVVVSVADVVPIRPPEHDAG